MWYVNLNGYLLSLYFAQVMTSHIVSRIPVSLGALIRLPVVLVHSNMRPPTCILVKQQNIKLKFGAIDEFWKTLYARANIIGMSE